MHVSDTKPRTIARVGRHSDITQQFTAAGQVLQPTCNCKITGDRFLQEREMASGDFCHVGKEVKKAAINQG